jgi:hypothetical protein
MAGQVDFYSMLSGLGDTIAKQRTEAARKQALSGAIGPDGQIDFQKAMLGLSQIGDVETAARLAQIAGQAEDRKFRQSTDARDFGFRQQESQRQDAFRRDEARRAQQNADRNFDKDKYVIKEDANGNLIRVKTSGDEGPIAGGAATPGNPFAGAGGKFNEGQGKAAGFADRMLGSENILSGSGPGEGFEGPAAPGVQGQGASRVEASLSKIPIAGNYLTSSDQKSYEQAKRTFINSQLRRESGATIQDAEFKNAEQQYFPQPGDDANTISQKAATRRSAIEAMGREGGPSYRPQQTYDKHGKISPYAAPKSAATGRPISKAQYDALPSGSVFTAPDGTQRVKP